MRKHLITIFWLIVLCISAYFSYKFGYNYMKDNAIIKFSSIIFITGISLSAFAYSLLATNKNESLTAYKRELEKESIDKTESSSRIKVLESKIQVLEKALEDALNK